MLFPLRIWHLIVLIGTNYHLHKNNALNGLKIVQMKIEKEVLIEDVADSPVLGVVFSY